MTATEPREWVVLRCRQCPGEKLWQGFLTGGSRPSVRAIVADHAKRGHTVYAESTDGRRLAG